MLIKLKIENKRKNVCSGKKIQSPMKMKKIKFSTVIFDGRRQWNNVYKVT